MPTSCCTQSDKNDQNKRLFLTQGINCATGKMLNSEREEIYLDGEVQPHSQPLYFTFPKGLQAALRRNNYSWGKKITRFISDFVKKSLNSSSHVCVLWND